ncbi:cytochrome P450 2C14 [Elysia marginata]|uniref:Cytochrome P450 2C14 n=1 Tax=Elysia marginata TaxID=1093978 RepID=A0AAV4IV54_9GAST|nr:cytochrome P450 2C14 [Elysia marginata]
MRHILVKHAEFTSDGPVDLSSQVVGEDNHGMLTSRGPNWKEQRSTAMSILLKFVIGKDIKGKKVESEVQIYIEKLASFQGQAIDLPLLTNAAVSNVVCYIIFGDRFDYEDNYFKRTVDNLCAFVLEAPTPWIFYAATALKRLTGGLFGI